MASQSFDIESTVPQAEDEWIRQSCGFYACPTCKQDLEPAYDGLSCRVCARTYPILSGIPDFIVVNLEESRNRSLRVVGKNDSRPLLDAMASVYETWVYPAVCNLYGGWHSTSLKQLAHDVSDIVGSRDGVILDAACGPGTYGRRIASASRTVLGIDICMSMLRRGARYVERGHIPNVHFARATVEALPFRAGLFDAAICAGSLEPLLRRGPRFARDQPHHESRSAAGGDVLCPHQLGPHQIQIDTRPRGERRRSHLQRR